MAMSKVDIGPLKDTVSYSICMETLDDPRSLPCMHVFCKKCIQDVMDRHKRNFPCPICRDTCPIPDQGAAALKVNFFANSVLDAMKGLNIEETDEKETAILNCDKCIKGGKTIPAVSQCLECDEKLCRSCKRRHKRSRLSKSHHILDLTIAGFKSLEKAAVDMISQLTINCREHKNKPLKYFCKDDQRLICQDCFAFNHQGHELENIEKAGNDSKDDMSSAIDLFRQKSDMYIKGIKTGNAELENMQKHIDESMAKLPKGDQLAKLPKGEQLKEFQAKVAAQMKGMMEKANNLNSKSCIADLESEKKALVGLAKQLETLVTLHD
ncbi:unnamed protein product [Owenia fusiformis]|uniref:Uncharacterized protein n=1 Tax=Owenia fusiformis TaxID=6347 RepID=A0A8J1XU75_OWEFU|nr:unnamed protein product [Owenia fusiformis]